MCFVSFFSKIFSQKTTKEIIINDIYEKELFKILPVDNVISEDKSSHKIALTSSIIGTAPNAIASYVMQNSYKIVFPAGTSGNLMRYSNGLIGTPIIKGGKIVGHAGLKSLALNPATITLTVFTAASFVTGQYFMAIINEKLEKISNKIDELKRIVLSKIKAEVFSSASFLQYAYQNIDEIANSKEHKIATLTNVQHSTQTLMENMFFYEDNISCLMENIKSIEEIGQLEKTINEVFEYLSLWRFCVSGVFIGRVIEIRLSNNYDTLYLNKVKGEFKNKSECFQTFISELQIRTETIIKSKATDRNIAEKATGLFNKIFSDGDYITKGEKKAQGEKSRMDVYLNGLQDEKNNYTDVINGVDRLINLNNKGFELYYNGDNYYISENK